VTALELAGRGLGLDYGTVALVESDERWREAFGQLARELRACLGDIAVEIEHVGSTAVPGLPSKPILDVAVRLAPTADLEEVIALLERNGFEYRGDKGELGGHLFVLEARVRHRVAHVHVVDYGDASWGQYLVFRDRLRQDADARARYAAVKRDLARAFPESRPGYTAGKAAIITAILGAGGSRTDVAPGAQPS
jgi:GrpB-like predicted nucleotidyltransferase (UPF0157 family)